MKDDCTKLAWTLVQLLKYFGLNLISIVENNCKTNLVLLNIKQLLKRTKTTLENNTYIVLGMKIGWLIM